MVVGQPAAAHPAFDDLFLGPAHALADRALRVVVPAPTVLKRPRWTQELYVMQVMQAGCCCQGFCMCNFCLYEAGPASTLGMSR